MKGIPAQTYRDNSNCTNGGISSRYDRFVLTGEGIAEVFEPDDDMPELQLKVRCGTHLCCEPSFEPTGAGWMFGGNFLYSSDSRFPEYPIAIHDRQEFRDFGSPD